MTRNDTLANNTIRAAEEAEHLTTDDRADLINIAEALRGGYTERALELAGNLDTAVREEIPPHVWKAMGGELTETGEARMTPEQKFDAAIDGLLEIVSTGLVDDEARDLIAAAVKDDKAEALIDLADAPEDSEAYGAFYSAWSEARDAFEEWCREPDLDEVEAEIEAAAKVAAKAIAGVAQAVLMEDGAEEREVVTAIIRLAVSRQPNLQPEDAERVDERLSEAINAIA